MRWEDERATSAMSFSSTSQTLTHCFKIFSEKKSETQKTTKINQTNTHARNIANGSKMFDLVGVFPISFHRRNGVKFPYHF